jgi:cbb3-type cytochrome oxidase maturation protein
MSALIYLIPAAIGLGLFGLAGFLWALSSGQYDDLDAAGQTILEDEVIAQPLAKSDKLP